MRLTWKREPRETGLAGVCQGERGFDLRLNKEEIGYVRPYFQHGQFTAKLGYYWGAGDDTIGVKRHNSLWNKTWYKTVEEAKAACKAYVLAELKKVESAAPETTVDPTSE